MKKYIFIAIAALLVFAGAGCITIGAPSKSGIDGGIWKSVNKGRDWAQSNAAPTASGLGNINGINITDLVFDPQDNKAIYLASAGSGLFYTWDGTQSWKYVDSLGMGYINSVAIDHKYKCTLYAALQNKIWKSIDCARSWKNQYFDTRSEIYVSAVAVDPASSNIVYGGLSGGDLLKSADGGASWNTIRRFGNKIQKIFIHPKNSNLVFVIMQNNGLWKSKDAGANWTDLRSKMEKFPGANEIYDFDVDKEAKTMYLTSIYGIVLSEDLGESWRKIDLLTPPGSTRIYSFAVNPNNAQEIYYSTANTFYSSFDGGKNWTTKKLPTGRVGTALLVDPQNSSLIYLGTRKFE